MSVYCYRLVVVEVLVVRRRQNIEPCIARPFVSPELSIVSAQSMRDHSI